MEFYPAVLPAPELCSRCEILDTSLQECHLQRAHGGRHMMQAVWVSFAPDAEAADAASWRMAKLGRPMGPLEVIFNGSYSQHAVGDEGVAVRGAGLQAWETLNIRSRVCHSCSTQPAGSISLATCTSDCGKDCLGASPQHIGGRCKSQILGPHVRPASRWHFCCVAGRWMQRW